MATRTLTLPTLCPPEPNHREQCAACLRERLLATPGVRHVDLKPGPNGDASTATLELDYDPRLVPLHELDAELRRAGVCCQSQRASVLLGIEGMVSPRTEQLIEASLAKLPGVVASASFAGHSLRVEFDRTQCALGEIVRRLDALGLRVREGGPAKPQTAAADRKSIERVRDLIMTHHKLAMAIVGGILVLAAYLVHQFEGPAMLRYALVGAGIIIAGWYTAIDTYHVLRELKFDIDVLMFAAAFGAVLLGHYEEGGLLLVLFALGGAGEELAMDKARKAIEALAKLAPETATLRDDEGHERIVRVEDLKVGDRVVARPFDRLPADGAVESGASAVDQSPITGESVPVEKTAGAQVFVGTINGSGLLLVTVSKTASESTLAKIVRMVQEAQTTKSPTQVFTDRVEKKYVPFVLIATAALIFIPPMLVGQWGTWFYRAMAFLTAASPCALAIGTPAAVLSGIARAAQIGVLVKGGVHLENLGRVRAVALDKTGTLTLGRPQVTRIVPLGDSISEDRILALAASADASDTHPAATAIVAEAQARALALSPAENVTTLAGKGAVARIDGRDVYVGKLSPDVVTHAQVVPLANAGHMLAQVSVDDRPVGVIALADAPRPNAADTIAALHEMGVRPCIMLTGDRAAVAAPIAEALGIDQVHADLLPQDKVTLIRDLQHKHGPMAMIGDGVNDAPALATAAVGIAMGGAGTDVAIETADVALMGDDLSKLPQAIALSRFSRRIITQNLVIALGVISILAPLASLGYAYLGVAVMFHEGSTVVVVLNSMRLLLFRPKQLQP